MTSISSLSTRPGLAARVIVVTATTVALAAPTLASAQSPDHAAADAQASSSPTTAAPATTDVALVDDLGTHSYPADTSNASAQAYFNQGLRLYYAFNHAEAIRAFRVAQRLDPECALCWWGEALAWGPNINMPMDAAGGEAAYRAVQQALDVGPDAPARERALVEALAVRYQAEPPADRARLDAAYATAMGALAARYPDDNEMAVLYAESLMDLRPWDYWTPEKEPQPGIAEALAHLERVQRVDPNHPGACHFFIHAVEKEYPERAIPCAERLASLMPGAGHIVHMPGHIYIRVGRYHDAIEANRHAIHADETYIQDLRPGATTYTAGYYPHNYDFLAFASSMIGRGEDAVSSSDRVAALIPPDMLGAEGMAFLEHWTMRPLLFRVRFRRWDELLGTPQPDARLPHAMALWHYARGRALAGTGDVEGAARHRAALEAAIEDPSLRGVRMEFNQSVDLLRIADGVLAGWIAAERGQLDQAVRELEQAVAIEDALLYGEPPEWSVPVRHDLGAILLRAERWDDAERVFRQDLERFPDNGWSLAGLARTLESQQREQDARAVRAQLEKVWATADVAVPF